MRMPLGEVAAVGVVADLVALAEDVQRILALEHLEHEVRDDVAQGELDVAAHDVRVADGPPLADADAVERPQDRVRQPYCSWAPLAKYSLASFWKPYVEIGGGLGQLGALGRREDGRRLVDHRRC